jgi:hypothetical protein
MNLVHLWAQPGEIGPLEVILADVRELGLSLLDHPHQLRLPDETALVSLARGTHVGAEKFDRDAIDLLVGGHQKWNSVAPLVFGDDVEEEASNLQNSHFRVEGLGFRVEDFRFRF